MKAIRIILLILIILGIIALSTEKTWLPKLVNYIISHEHETVVAAPTSLTDGTYCFARSQKATPSEPYAVEETIKLTVAGNTINGTKDGTQQGPDMSNGYTGTLQGSMNGNILNVIYSYTIEGSANKEAEEYEFKYPSLLKRRWSLKENGGTLVPDRSGSPVLISYGQKECL